ncbi:hypothetical protein AB0L82_38450 [Nocardia sp. NPDC052001]|uniref:hypothetical protein n=1 Tax=Nocardia sp. NPDC052001 TaxID=3154853 RepID=UPI003419D634
MSTVDYPISLAIEDYVPVLCTAFGVLLLHRIAPSGPAVRLAAALLGIGGIAKATAKLIAAAGGPDLIWLRGMLFPFLTLGFGLLTVALLRDGSGRVPRWLAILVPSLIAACALGAILARDALPMLVSTTVFATIASIHLIGLARARGDTVSAALLGIQLLVFFLLGPLASRPDQTVALQWIEQLCNTAAQVAFLAAAWRLSATHAAPKDQEMIH